MKCVLSFVSETVVTEQNLAKSMGSGDLAVFATPAMAALMENAAMNAVAKELPEGSTTVGAKLDISHVRPTAIGETVKATAVLEECEGRKLVFKVSASDSKGIIGEGTHVRYVVEIKRFMSKLQ